MSFYLVDSWTQDGVYNGKELIFFNSEIEKIEFSKKYYEKYWEKVFYFKPKSLKEVIAYIYHTNDISYGISSNIVHKEIKEIFDEIVLNFGLDFINEKFPNEDMNNEFIDSIQILIDEMEGELMEEFNNHNLDCGSGDYGKTDWEISYDDETSKWDDETDNSWRIENDFG